MIERFFAYLIICLGVVNALRMSFYFILADIYDLKHSVRTGSDKDYTPLVSIVIAAYNEEKVIMRTLTSVEQSLYKNIEVIVVDDGSKDRTSEFTRSYIQNSYTKNITLVRQDNGGKARALNNAIKNYANGELVMCLDADSILEKHAISNVVSYFTNPQVASVAANVRIMDSKTILGKIQYIEYLMGHRLKKAYTILNNEYIVGGIGSTFRRSVMEKVNFYDTDSITEDIALTMKIVNQGNKVHKVIFAEDVICYTEAVLSLHDLYRQRYRWKYGRFQTLYKNLHLFFKVSKRHTKRLTFFQLPFVLYSELTFLIDPLLIFFVLYISIRYHEIKSLGGAFVFLAFYAAITVLSDSHLSLKRKITSLLYTPFAYLFFFVVSIVEYKALIQSIVDYKGIIYAKEIDKCGWEHVARA